MEYSLTEKKCAVFFPEKTSTGLHTCFWWPLAPDLHLCYKETWKSQGNTSYRKLLIALHLKSNLKSQFFNQFCFIFMWLGRNMRQFPINSLHLCPWSDMLTNERDNPSNSNKNFWFLKRIYLIHYTVITVESKPCL